MHLRIQTLLSNQIGNVAVIFALCLVPIGALIAFSIDFNMSSSNKSRTQFVVDAAAVSGARARLNGVRGTELCKDLIALIETQTETMPGITCDTPVIIDAWWRQEVMVEMSCRSGRLGSEENDERATTFSVAATGRYASRPVFSPPPKR